jgi:group I intron endonuclease
MLYTVYVHRVPNGKVYVGVTSRNPRVRWNYGNGYRSNGAFYQAIREFGWNNIAHEIAAQFRSEDLAYSLECDLIAHYDSTNPDKGYNRATGGKGTCGVVISDETRKRLSDSHVGLKQNRTDEWNNKIKQALTGKRKPHKGVPRDAACRAKIAQAHSKKVLQFDQNMNLINTFASAREAEQALNIRNQYISQCCNGKRATAGGYIWKFDINMEE